MENDVEQFNESRLVTLDKRLDEEIQKSQHYEEEIQVLYELIHTKDAEIEQLKFKLRIMEGNQIIKKPTQKKRKTERENVSRNGNNSDDEINHPEIEKLEKINEVLTEQAVADEIERSIKKQLDKMQETLMSMIDLKLSSNGNNENTHNPLSKMDQKQDKTIANSYASVLNCSKNSEKKNAAKLSEDKLNVATMVEKNKKIVEEADKTKRAKNIIILGRKEGSSQNDDFNFLCNLLEKTAENNANVQSFERIGKSEENKRRPIKMVFKNAQDKERMMGNLRKLKGDKEFEGIHIRHDLTLSERNMIKIYLEKARVKNEEEVEGSRFVWKLRGNPKSGLLLKRYAKEDLGHSKL